MTLRKSVLLLLVITVLAPLFLYTERLGTFSNSGSTNEFLGDASSRKFGGEIGKLNVLPQELSNPVKEPVGLVFSEKPAISTSNLDELNSNSLRKVLRMMDDGNQSEKDTTIRLVTDKVRKKDESDRSQKPGVDLENGSKRVKGSEKVEKLGLSKQSRETHSGKQEINPQKQSPQTSGNVSKEEQLKTDIEKRSDKMVMPDARVRQLRDQLIRAKVLLGLGPIRSNAHFAKELRLRIREVQRVVGDATKDSELPRNANDKLEAMEQTLAKGKQIQDDCNAVVKKLRAFLHSTEEQLRVHRRQNLFLTQLAAKTLTRGLHCLPLRLTTEYHTLNSSQQQFPNQEKLEDPDLYHFTVFSDNILATGVVVNSTVVHAKEPAKHVFHIVTDRLNYAAMRMWFLANPPGKATIQVQNIEEFTWLNSSYSPVLKQLGTPSMIDYYFRTHKANSDSNLKFRNPKYLSILNHLRFYLPQIFPKLNKVLFLDDDIVVQKDLTGLWTLDLKGNVNGAVETCGESFHRFDKYLNFSNPLISKNFDPHACGWAYGMNIFDLAEWRKQKMTEVYHSWQKLNHDRQLWKLGTLPPGLLTFWKRTHALDRSWHVLGLGYDPNVNQKEIERAAVIHYNGNLKPWLEIGLPKFRNYWAKFVNYDQVYLQDCNLNP